MPKKIITFRDMLLVDMKESPRNFKRGVNLLKKGGLFDENRYFVSGIKHRAKIRKIEMGNIRLPRLRKNVKGGEKRR